MKSKPLLICAPSGSGKSTVARFLRRVDDRFKHVQVLTDRELRDNELDGIEKVHAPLAELIQMDARGELLNLNQKYGTWYGIRHEAISALLAQGYFPVLEWPLERIPYMNQHHEVFSVLLRTVEPALLFERLKDGRDKDGTRAKALEEEFAYMTKNPFAADLTVRNHHGDLFAVAAIIYAAYLNHIA